MSTINPISNLKARNWAWVWAAYTGFLFIQPVFEPSVTLWIATTIAFVAFLAIFGFYMRTPDSAQTARLWMIAAMVALGLVTFPWNQGASCFFVYAACFIPFVIIPVRKVMLLFLLICLVVVAEGYFFTVNRPHGFFHIGWPNVIVALLLVLVIGGGQIFIAQDKRAGCLLRAAQEENLALAAVAERERIARDLHDVLGHTLSVIVLKAELAGRLLIHAMPDPARAANEIADVERIARTALADVREAIGGYRSQGLAAEIEAARRTLDTAAVSLIVDSASDTTAGLTSAEETVLALALREAVTNIVRHAQATTCTLRFITVNGRRRLVVEDNGHHAATREGNGLRGMRERVESLGGQLSLERDSGTRILIDLPLHAEAS